MIQEFIKPRFNWLEFVGIAFAVQLGADGNWLASLVVVVAVAVISSVLKQAVRP